MKASCKVAHEFCLFLLCSLLNHEYIFTILIMTFCDCTLPKIDRKGSVRSMYLLVLPLCTFMYSRLCSGKTAENI